jgi:hypothetical protein
MAKKTKSFFYINKKTKGKVLAIFRQTSPKSRVTIYKNRKYRFRKYDSVILKMDDIYNKRWDIILDKLKSLPQLNTRDWKILRDMVRNYYTNYNFYYKYMRVSYVGRATVVHNTSRFYFGICAHKHDNGYYGRGTTSLVYNRKRRK